ncbi:MAG: SH3 domain-containing protein, partial [Eubacterium sp.]|nr:SH3 domain-containing protein [Eubacterium sp.]
MKNTIKKLCVSFLLAMFIFSITGVSGADSQLSQVSAAKVVTGKVSSRKLNIRVAKSKSAKILKTIKKGKKVNVLEAGKKWVKVSVAGVIGYTKGEYIKTSYGNASNLYKNAISGKVTRKA